MLPGSGGDLERALLICSDPGEPWDAASLPAALPAGDWALADTVGCLPVEHAVLGWALASYGFRRYRPDEVQRPRLVLVADREVQCEVDVAHEPELVHRALGRRQLAGGLDHGGILASA